MLTDLSHSSENAEVFIDDVSKGTCAGGNQCDGCCTWYTCNVELMQPLQVTPTTTSISVKLEYTNSVSSTYATCTDSVSGESGGGVARIKLTPPGSIK